MEMQKRALGTGGKGKPSSLQQRRQMKLNLLNGDLKDIQLHANSLNTAMPAALKPVGN
jgi:hypothetical protein